MPGLIPLMCWLAFLLLKNRGRAFFLWLAVGVTIFHIFLFAVSAHSDGATYWSIQFIEIAALCFLVRGKAAFVVQQSDVHRK